MTYTPLSFIFPCGATRYVIQPTPHQHHSRTTMQTYRHTKSADLELLIANRGLRIALHFNKQQETYADMTIHCTHDMKVQCD